MPSDLTPRTPNHEVVSRRERRAAASMQYSTALQIADVQSHGIVQSEKMREIDRLARDAASGQAMLHQWAATLAHGDPFLADELKHFSDLARLGKSEILIDTIHRYSRSRP